MCRMTDITDKNNFSEKELTGLIREKALGLGFNAFGVTPAYPLDVEKEQLSAAILEKRTALMDYLHNSLDIRANPALYLENAASVIMVLISYYPERIQNQACSFKVTRYAYGKDYHIVIKKKLEELLEYAQSLVTGLKGKYFVDSAPVLEKAWAQRCGLGWRGKNTLVINEKLGSFCYLGGIITNTKLEYDQPEEDKCGSCRKCMDACPAGALAAPHKLDASKCISYHNIENRKDLLPGLSTYHGWIYGCDICQEVCPWNNDIPHSTEPAFGIKVFIERSEDKAWLNLDEENFNAIFSDSAVKRCGYEKLMKNIWQEEQNSKLL